VDPLRETDKQRERHTHTQKHSWKKIFLPRQLGLLFSGATWKPFGFHNFSGLGLFFFPGNLAALRLSELDAILFYLILKNKMNTSISRGNILMLVRKGRKKNIIITKRKFHARGIELGNLTK
jgi:hypothetical protein